MKVHKNKMSFHVVMHKKTGVLAELQLGSWFGKIIWLVDYDEIPKGAIACDPYLIYNDDKRFNDYESLGEL